MNIKPYTFVAPTLPRTIVPTGFMIEMENRFKAVFFQTGFLVWYGLAGAGKTTCGEWLVERINAAFDPNNQHAYKAMLYEAGKNTGKNSGQRTLLTLHKFVSGYNLDVSYQRYDVEPLAMEVLHTIKRKRIGLICIDEAGLLTVDAISALALLLDMAKSQSYPLTIILIGMDDLPSKMDQHTRPQLYRRVHQWCNFKDYDLQDTFNLLKGLHPHFNSINPTIPDQWSQVRLIHELTNALPGLIVQFLAKFDATYKKIPHLITTTLLRSIHLQGFSEYQEILATSRGLVKPTSTSNGSSAKIKTGKSKADKNNTKEAKV